MAVPVQIGDGVGFQQLVVKVPLGRPRRFEPSGVAPDDGGHCDILAAGNAGAGEEEVQVTVPVQIRNVVGDGP